MEYKIIASTWLTENFGPTIGVVAIELEDGNWKCYLGNCIGSDEKLDEQIIATQGAKIYQKEVACGFFPHLDPERFRT